MRTMKIAFQTTLAGIIAFSFFVFFQCKSEESSRKTVLEESKATKHSGKNEFQNLPEGFINSSSFQVVVSSLKSNDSSAEKEAISVAEKKSFQMLQTYPKKPLSAKGRKELKLISGSGKITKKGSHSGKKYFVYRIQKPGLKILVESKLP